MKQRKMYIDVDGVLVVWDSAFNCIEISRGFGRLMRFCLIHEIQPCWLSKWCEFPDHLTGLSRLLWPDTATTMAAPEIIDWEGKLKAEAIDYESDFVWIEDGIGEKNAAYLRERGALHRFFHTDGLDPECLIKFMEFTSKTLKLGPIEDWGPFMDSHWTRPRTNTVT